MIFVLNCQNSYWLNWEYGWKRTDYKKNKNELNEDLAQRMQEKK